MRLTSLTPFLSAIALLALMGFQCSRTILNDNITERRLALTCYTSFGSSEKASITMSAYDETEAEGIVDVHLYRITDPLNVFPQYGTSLDFPGSESAEQRLTERPESAKNYPLLQTWSVHLNTSAAAAAIAAPTLTLPSLEPGLYLVEGWFKGSRATVGVVISDAHVVVKRSPTGFLAFVTDRRTGRGIPFMELKGTGFLSTNHRFRTDSNGVALITPSDGMSMQSYEGREVGFVGEKDGEIVIYTSHIDYRTPSTGMVIHAATDRPLYRPSQTVNYRAIIRQRNSPEMIIPKKSSATIMITDNHRKNLYSRTLPLDSFGIITGSIVLPDAPSLGMYTVTITAGYSRGSATFFVEEYKKSEFEVAVTARRTDLRSGDTLRASLRAGYYFGGPVEAGSVRWSLLRLRTASASRRSVRIIRTDDTTTQNYDLVATAPATLKSDGTAEFIYPLGSIRTGIYVVRAEVTDPSRRRVTSQAKATVRGNGDELRVDMAKNFYRTGEELQIPLHIVALDDLPMLKERSPRDISLVTQLNVIVQRRIWKLSPAGSDGSWREVKSEVSKGIVRTDRSGTGTFSMIPKDGGNYLVTFSGELPGSGRVEQITTVTVVGPTFEGLTFPGDTKRIITDRASYKPGDTVTALMMLSQQGTREHDDVDLLVTLEGEGIESWKGERLASDVALTRFVLPSDSTSIVRIAAIGEINGQILAVDAPIHIKRDLQSLHLEVLTNRATYAPGDSGMITVRALAPNGQPVARAALAVGVVDEAIYAIHPDETPDITNIFTPALPSFVKTEIGRVPQFFGGFQYSPRIYEEHESNPLDLSSSGSSRRSAPTTPTVVGSSIAPPTTTAANQTVQPQSDATASTDPKGRYDELEPITIINDIRRSFQDVALWAPLAITDGDGYARVGVRFPDNVTTWRTTVRGIAGVALAGETRTRTITHKDLILRLETPRYLIRDDSIVVAATIHNSLPTAADVRLDLDGEHLAVKQRTWRITIPSGSERRLDVPVRAMSVGDGEITGRATAIVKSTGEEFTDAVEAHIPIHSPGVLRCSGGSRKVSVDSSSNITVTLPKDADTATSSLTITITPSVESAMIGSLESLIGYPYGCVEQTMSKFLPTIVVFKVLSKLNIPFNNNERNKIPAMVSRGIDRLLELQHNDGGWGWWKNDATNPFMTAYVVNGLTIARSVGYSISDNDYERGRNALRNLLLARSSGGAMRSQEAILDPTTEAYMLYVATGSGGAEDRAYHDRLRDLSNRTDLNNYAVALCALTGDQINEKSTADSMRARLINSAEIGDNTASWSGKSWDYRWQEDHLETTAYALRALLGDSTRPLVAEAMHWLLLQKQGNSWGSTRQSAMTIFALCDAISTIPPRVVVGDGKVRVLVNGREVLAAMMASGNTVRTASTVVVPGNMLRIGENIVTIDGAGRENLYASTSLSYYSSEPDDITSQIPTIPVRRTYSLLHSIRKGDRIVYTKEPFTGTLTSGDEILVEVTVTPTVRMEYFMVEDPLPPGCQVITRTEGYEIEGDPDNFGRQTSATGWDYWYSDMEIHDDRIAFFATVISPGEHRFSYIVRAQIPGVYHINPTHASLAYFPKLSGASGGASMVITAL